MGFSRKLLLPALLAAGLLGSAAFFMSGPPAVADSEAPPPPEGFTLDGADLDNGKELFAKHCKVCHGATGAGDGTLSEHLNPHPGDLRKRVAERTPWEVYVVIRDGGQAIGRSPVMVGFGNRLSEEELRDVAAFTLELAEEK